MLVRICPYLSVFVRLCEKKFIFLDFSWFQAPEIRQNPCKTAEKWLSLQCSKQLCKSEDVKLLRLWRCRYSSSCVESHALSMSTLASYSQISITSYHLSHPPLASKINDHQNLSKIAPCTPIFTKFEPRIGKSTTPQMDNWRPKTMRRTPKSGIFRPSARPFFHQKRGRIALWIHWRTLQLIDFQYSKQFKGVKGVKVSKCQTHFGREKSPIIIFKIYIYFKSSKRHIWWCTLTLWHFDTLTPCSIVAYAFPQKHRIW